MNDGSSMEDRKNVTDMVMQGVKEAVLARSVDPIIYREIWEGMIGKMFDTLESGTSEKWKELPAELQYKIATEKIKRSVPQCLELVGEVKNLILEECTPSSVQ